MVTFWIDAGMQVFLLLGKSASALYLTYGAWLVFQYCLEEPSKDAQIEWISMRESQT